MRLISEPSDTLEVVPISTLCLRDIACLLAIIVGVTLSATCGLAGSDLLCLAPALLLAAMLLLRRYPGERILVAIHTRPAARWARHETSAPASSRPAPRVPRGGLLLAFALAVRPPPPALSAS